MIDWSRGGFTGSLNRLVDREIREHFRANAAARRARYSLGTRIWRRCFGGHTFASFLLWYLAILVMALLMEALAGFLGPTLTPHWLPLDDGNSADINSLITNVASYLITAQVGVLGVISIAIALVTLMAQRESSQTDLQLYYHEASVFQVVASCIALLAVLCAQLLWPAQLLLHQFGAGTSSPIFKLALLCIHIVWLLLNLVALAHFIATTFRFVQQSAREELRERYTANVVLPVEMSRRLRAQLYGTAGTEFRDAVAAPGGGDRGTPWVWFGSDFDGADVIEIQSRFERPSVIHDVRMRWVRWVARRWIGRCKAAAAKGRHGGFAGLSADRPALMFTPRLEQRLHGNVGWCRRRGGVPLTWLERAVLRRAFRFRRARDEA